MTPAAMNRAISRQVDALHRNALIDDAAHARISARYPLSRWHWQALSRWFVIFGAVTAFTGIAIGARSLFDFTLEKLAVVLALSSIGGFAVARLLQQSKPHLRWSVQALELLAAFLLIALTFTLGAIFDDGSGNWPALVAVDLAAVLALAYLLENRLLLVLAAVLFFVWFGGMTGYSSGWRVYWFGMNYPMRFLIASIAIIAMGTAHLHAAGKRAERYGGFAKIWTSCGLFFAQMSLWLLSLFGNFNLEDGWQRAPDREIFMFNVLWLAANVALLFVGIRFVVRMATGYAATFLIIHIYTLFFTYLAEDLGTFTSLFVSGASALALAFWLERRRRMAADRGAPA